VFKGFRTLIPVATFIVTGLLSTFGALDLTPLVSMFVRDPMYLGAAMVGVGLLFGFLRYLTTTPLFSAKPAPQPPGEVEQIEMALKRDVDAGG
jgi:hypothetical protein